MPSEPFIADLHIHSKFSRATARHLDIENIYIWAQLKGIRVVGTGDFTHPEWFSQIKEKLKPAEPGLYQLRSDISRHCDQAVPHSCRAPVRFILSCEISNIYKKADHTRKNHNLVFFPELDQVHMFNTRLDGIGNINADGRPILGLDARNLLEIVLETSDEGFLVPAHIWTPWFSMLGSKSGFDSIEACFGDLSSYIFAAETGLSSDPSMNWRVADLDNITLVSNSDAHSPAKLGREANQFTTEMDYFAMRSALKSGNPNHFGGTFEYYPEEGKYHIDGHRKCGVSFTPAETQSHSGKCPVCKKPLTLGVLHRVEQLATRPEGARPKNALPFYHLIPLDDLLSEIFRVGPQSKKVKQSYHALLENLGSELNILHSLDKKRIESAGVPLLAEAIQRMRDKRVTFAPGYDGLFGKLHIFSDQERNHLCTQRRLFSSSEIKIESNKTDKQAATTICVKPSPSSGVQTSGEPIQQSRIMLNDEQQAAVEYQDGHVMIVAGPGTGKTRTLTHKIARLIEKGALCERLLALTFTNKAAVEMKSRLRDLLGNTVSAPFVGTFHGLGYQILSGVAGDTPLSVVDDGAQRSLIDDTLKLSGKSKRDRVISVDELLAWIVAAKQSVCGAEATYTDDRFQKNRTRFNAYYDFYQHLLQINGLVDFEDLIAKSIDLLETHSYIRERFIGRFSHLFIDEYQDINAGQYRLIQLLADDQAKICIIGDPDQSIYGFRGSQADCFDWFKKDHPDVRTIFLNRNYRSTQTILEISSQVIRNNPPWQENGIRQKVYSHLNGDRTVSVGHMATENAEAVAIGKRIETMVGGTGFFSMDSGVTDSRQDYEPLSFADFAVLFRTRKQGKIILLALEKAGIPCQLVDRQALLNHPGVKELMAIFKLIHGLGLFDDLQNVGRLLKPSLSKVTVASVKSWAYANDLSLNQALVQARRIPIPGMNRAQQRHLYAFIKQIDGLNRQLSGQLVDKTIQRIVDKCGFRQMYASDQLFSAGLGRVLETAAGHQTDAAGFMSAVALSSNTDLYDHRVEKVALMTMHAAKGLEFSVVFVAGCEDGYIPYRDHGKASDLQEERRLFYVALTRAKKHLFLTRADRRRVNGEMRNRQWSPFVAEIENSYKRIRNWKGKKRNRPAQQQLSLF